MINKKIILWVVGIFAVLAAVYVWISGYSIEMPGQEMPKKESISIFETAVEKIISVKLENEHGVFEFVPSNTGYSLKDNDKILLDSQAVLELYRHGATVAATDIADETPEDLSLYGFAHPKARVTVTTDGESKMFFVGDMLSEKTGYYFKEDTSDIIYVISHDKGSSFCADIEKYRSYIVTGFDPETITSVSVDGPEGSLAVTLNQDTEVVPAKWLITSFYNKPADDKYTDEKLITPVSEIVATGVETDKAESDEKYNLDTQVTITTTDISYSFLVGKGETEGYVRINGLPTVYTVKKEAIGFTELITYDILERYVYLVYMDDINGVTVTLPDKVYVLKIDRKNSGETYTINGKNVDSEKFKSLYQKVIGISADAVISGAETGPLAAKIKFDYINGKTLEISFYEYDNLNYSVYENGKCLFYTKKQNISDIADVLKNA